MIEYYFIRNKDIKPLRSPDFSYEFIHYWDKGSDGLYRDEIWIEEGVMVRHGSRINIKNYHTNDESLDYFSCDFLKAYYEYKRQEKIGLSYERILPDSAIIAYESWLKKKKKKKNFLGKCKTEDV